VSEQGRVVYLLEEKEKTKSTRVGLLLFRRKVHGNLRKYRVKRGKEIRGTTTNWKCGFLLKPFGEGGEWWSSDYRIFHPREAKLLKNGWFGTEERKVGSVAKNGE